MRPQIVNLCKERKQMRDKKTQAIGCWMFCGSKIGVIMNKLFAGTSD